MLKYNVQLNNGNEAFGVTEKTITANEVTETVDSKFLAHHLNLHSHGLIPENIAQLVLDNFCAVAAELMGQGHAVVLTSKGKAALRLYPDIHVKGGNINLARAQELMEGVTELTLENATELVQRAGLTLRAKAECEPAMGVLLDQSKSGLTLNELVNVPYVQRKDGTATPTPTPTDPTPGNQGGNGDNGGGNDGMS
jgi:hypothetical protein